jgi:hypothetical protein
MTTLSEICSTFGQGDNLEGNVSYFLVEALRPADEDSKGVGFAAALLSHKNSLR